MGARRASRGIEWWMVGVQAALILLDLVWACWVISLTAGLIPAFAWCAVLCIYVLYVPLLPEVWRLVTQEKAILVVTLWLWTGVDPPCFIIFRFQEEEQGEGWQENLLWFLTCFRFASLRLVF